MTGSTCKISPSQSSAAVYWCESGSGEFSNSVNITFHVAVSGTSVFPVLLIVGLVCGFILIVLIVLCCYRQSRAPCFSRFSQRANQSSATEQAVSQYENQPVYSSLLHGDDCVYETVRRPGNTGTGTHDNMKESSDYYNMDPNSTTGRCCDRFTQTQRVNEDESQQHVYSVLLHGQSSVVFQQFNPKHFFTEVILQGKHVNRV
ncbi:uncharacterized protein LOC113125198 [Mastacembelus armatus]|uniref:uncharacterized protein LOC113125198 n=1 Tax=Mastacembelus armatus TaxID=205130 RepID=UPI000E45CCFE|nr:uncharacterized protein LOC113125198 [Mastacembelus armatus]